MPPTHEPDFGPHPNPNRMPLQTGNRPETQADRARVVGGLPGWVVDQMSAGLVALVIIVIVLTVGVLVMGAAAWSWKHVAASQARADEGESSVEKRLADATKDFEQRMSGEVAAIQQQLVAARRVSSRRCLPAAAGPDRLVGGRDGRRRRSHRSCSRRQ